MYLRRGELVIHFSSPADLISRVVETAAVLSERERPDNKERGSRRRSVVLGTQSNASPCASDLGDSVEGRDD